MLRPIDVEGIPTGIWQVDPSAQFQAGMIGGLISLGGEVVMTVADGVNVPPYGLFDDFKTNSFTRPVYNERFVVTPNPAIVTEDANENLVLAAEASGTLMAANIVAHTIRTDVAFRLLPVNGVGIFPAGTLLNLDNDEDGTLDSIVAIVSYMYEMTGVSGEDTTRGSGKVTVWNRRGEYITDQFDTLATYPLNAPLYVCNGKLTTSRPCETAAVVAMVTGPPSTSGPTLQFLWF